MLPRKVGGKTGNIQDLQIPDVDLHRAMHVLYNERLEQALACSFVALIPCSISAATVRNCNSRHARRACAKCRSGPTFWGKALRVCLRMR
jgi:hypothetical protein